jgi:hypothetical protein
MNFIRWWTVGLMLLGATMTLTLSVVCLQYFIYMDSLPQLRDEWPLLLRSVELFLALALIGLAAFIPLRRRNRWLWPAQAMLLAGTAIIGVTFWRMLGA